ncbi:MAG TPA: 5'/3'-nucleotidase SurE [Baekduia sp.]|nr:5'/3'-nucleotidase SurE [Baekduia sp.]
MRVLLTNDDGIEAKGILALREALVALPGVEVLTIAPDTNRSAIGRGITTTRPLWVTEVPFEDGTVGYAADGTPVDCVRLGRQGIVDGFEPDLVVAGINHGGNLGDDVTYSGTVAAAFEGIVLGLPAIAISQQSDAREVDFQLGRAFDFTWSARFAGRLVEEIDSVPLPEGTLLNVNAPAGEPTGVEVARLGKRIYRDELILDQEDGEDTRRKRYWVYNQRPGFEDQPGTDIAVVAAGKIAVTPVHLDLTFHEGLDDLAGFDLASLIAPAAREIE